MIFDWDEMHFFDNDFDDKKKNSLPEDDDISHFDLDEPDINYETQFYYDENEDAYNKRITAEEEELENFRRKNWMNWMLPLYYIWSSLGRVVGYLADTVFH